MTPTLESLKRDAEGRQVNVSGWIATVFQDRHLPDQPLGLRSPGRQQTRLEWQQTLALAALLYGDDATLTYVVGRDHAGPKTITVPVIADPTFTWADAAQPDWRQQTFPPLPAGRESNHGPFAPTYAAEWQLPYARAQLRTGLSPLAYCLIQDLAAGDLRIDFSAQGEIVTRLTDVEHHKEDRWARVTTAGGTKDESYISRYRMNEYGHSIGYDQVRQPGEILPGDLTSPNFQLIHRPAADATVTLAEWVALTGRDGGNARRYAAAGRLPGAYKSGDTWLLPRTARVSPAPLSSRVPDSE